MWFLQYYAADWEAQHAADALAAENGTLPKKKRQKKEGKHKSTELLGEFLEIYERVQEARKDPVTGNGWDGPIMAEAEIQGASILKTAFEDHLPDGTVVAAKPEAKKFVMPMDAESDDDMVTGFTEV